MVRFGLRTQLLAGLALLTVAALGSAGAVALWAAETIARAHERQLGQSLARIIAQTYSSAQNPAALLKDLQRTGPKEPEELTVVNDAQRVVASTDDQLIGTLLRDRAVILALQTRESSEATSSRGRSYAEPLLNGSSLVGAVRVRLGRQSNAALARARTTIIVLILVDAALLVFLGAILLGGAVILPLGRVRELTRRVAAGEFGHTSPVEGTGEIAELTRAANDMSVALGEHVRKLRDAHDQLARSERLASVGRLASGVAHEVGNPLAAIMGFAEVLRDPDIPRDERIDLAGRIVRETARMHALLRELLDYARPVQNEIEPVRISEVVAAALSLVEHDPRWRGLRVEQDLAADLPPAAAGASQLVQVVVNLLLNAADAIGNSGRVGIFAHRSGDFLEACVSDSGPGVSPEIRERIFEPFVTSKAAGQGTGLGLAICQAIVESYGGSIALANKPGWGATFVIRLNIWRG